MGYRSKKDLVENFYSRVKEPDSDYIHNITLLQAYLVVVIYSDIYPLNSDKTKSCLLSLFSNIKEDNRWFMNERDYKEFISSCIYDNSKSIYDLSDFAIRKIQECVNVDFKEAIREIIHKDGIPTMYKIYRGKENNEIVYMEKYGVKTDILILNWCSYIANVPITRR